MKCIPLSGRTACTRTDVCAAVAAAGLLLVVALGSGATTRLRSEEARCLRNVGELARANLLYAADNRDYLPQPGWGTIPDATGVDTWAHATRNNQRIPGGPAMIPARSVSAGTAALFEEEMDRQIPWRDQGQLRRYVAGGTTFECPTDWRLWHSDPRFRLRFGQRLLKITSYCMNGAVVGYGQLPPGILTYRLGQFRGDAIAFWEPDDREPFNFNDAGQQPREAQTLRHSRGGNAGRFDGGAGYLSDRRYKDWAGVGPARPKLLPNPLWCSPGSPTGGG